MNQYTELLDEEIFEIRDRSETNNKNLMNVFAMGSTNNNYNELLKLLITVLN